MKTSGIAIFIVKIKGYLVSNYFHFKHIYKLRTSKKIIIGSSGKLQDGWFATDYPQIDITSIEQCKKFWKKDSKSAFFAEHVWEHLDEEDALKGAKCSFYFLKSKGRMRVAVPDGNHPDQSYIEHVRPNGTGIGADDHKVLHTCNSLIKVFQNAGFTVEPLEYWDNDGRFHKKDWDSRWGLVERSLLYDHRNSSTNPYAYTSVIVDCFKI